MCSLMGNVGVLNKAVNDGGQKQPPEVFCKKSCSLKFCKIHRTACNFIKIETLAKKEVGRFTSL